LLKCLEIDCESRADVKELIREAWIGGVPVEYEPLKVDEGEIWGSVSLGVRRVFEGLAAGVKQF
jgi:hypothetical protein